MEYNIKNIPSMDMVGKIITFRANLTKLIAPLIKMEDTKNVDLITEADRIVNDTVIQIIETTKDYYNTQDILNTIYELVFIEIYRLGIRVSLYKSDDTKIVNYINGIKNELYSLCKSLI